MIDIQKFKDDCAAVRSQSPLVHNITNYVAMNIAANTLLAGVGLYFLNPGLGICIGACGLLMCLFYKQ